MWNFYFLLPFYGVFLRVPSRHFRDLISACVMVYFLAARLSDGRFCNGGLVSLYSVVPFLTSTAFFQILTAKRQSLFADDRNRIHGSFFLFKCVRWYYVAMIFSKWIYTSVNIFLVGETAVRKCLTSGTASDRKLFSGALPIRYWQNFRLEDIDRVILWYVVEIRSYRDAVSYSTEGRWAQRRFDRVGSLGTSLTSNNFEKVTENVYHVPEWDF